MENVISTVPRTLSHGEYAITNHYPLGNYFAPVADTAKKNTNYSHKHFLEYLKHRRNNFIFMKSTESEDIANIISPHQ